MFKMAKRTSAVWELDVNDDTGKTVQCNADGDDTTNLLSHLNAKHPQEYQYQLHKFHQSASSQ